MMKSIPYLLFALFAALVISCSKAPNVILIMADDMGAECLSMYGGTSYQTPNLERMAENGLVVSHCISQPLCTPSRVKLMTGLPNSVNYTHFGRLDTTWLNMGTIMKEAGYRTCISGKWQLNGLSYPEQFPDWNDPTRPVQMGFDEYCLWQLTRSRSEGERYSDPLIEKNGKVLDTGPDDYGPDIFCDFILDFIDRNQDGPFFAYYPMVLVHDPFVPTPDSEEWSDAGARYRGDTAFFRDMMSYTDKIVGKINRKLEETGISDRTIVIFTADNGTNTQIVSSTGSRIVRGAKGNTITDGVRVPLLVSWPDKIAQGRVFKGLIEFSDFFATLADLTGREVKTSGHSFLPLLKDQNYRPRETVKVHYDPRWGARVNQYRNSFIQTMDFKLYQDGSFYNLREDILEEEPLSSQDLRTGEKEILVSLKKGLFNIPDAPPNLVVIITDDQGYGDLSLHGNPVLETPNLDAIGLGGVRLDNFHVSPVCAPTRAALLTGRSPLSTGTFWVTRGGEVMDDKEYTLAELLRDNGYSTGCFGKWHNGAHHPHHPLSQGFDEFFGFTAGHWNRYFDPELEHNGRMIRTEGYIADIFTDRAIDYIKDHRDGPFFCYLSYNTPHSPFQLPDHYFDRYINIVNEEDSLLRIMNASVYGMVRNIDDNVGRLVSTLEELQLQDNTVLVFLTDNGPNTWRYNGHMKGRKGWVNDGGVRVPCFIRWPGHIPEGKKVSSMTAHLDLLPTLTSLMGIVFNPENEIHGVDLTGNIMGVDIPRDRLLFTHVNRGGNVEPMPGAVRNNHWRLTFNQSDRLVLTKRSDAGEQIDLAGSLPGLADSLLDQYLTWFEPFREHKIRPIPVGIIDSVILPAHEGFLSGEASYRWSDNGWSNDWVHHLAGNNSAIQWNLSVAESAVYECYMRYTSREENAEAILEISGQHLEKRLPSFIPVVDRNYSRTDRPAEAIGQTWNRIPMGQVQLDTGLTKLTLNASSEELEVLSVVLLKR